MLYVYYLFLAAIMMLFFKDSKIGQELALFICKEKDDKDAKATTLIVHPPIIGRFSKRWAITLILLICQNGHRSFPLRVVLIILLASHHKNVAKSKSYNTLRQEIIEKRASWDLLFNANGGFSYFSRYWDWLEDELGQCKHLPDATHLYSAIFASLFTYDYNENLMKAFCDC